MKNRRNVLTNAGGGGPLLTGTIEQSKAINCHSELRERAEAQSENHVFRGAVLRESSKTVSGSVPRYERISNIGQTLNQVQGDNMALARIGFTMAEILLSLTIIGVVAAITLPSLTGNINERTWNTQRKALYARFSQAIALMPALNGYGTLEEESSAGASDAVDTVAETFITSGLSKVMKINNICDSDHIEDCGITSNYINYVGSSNSMPTDLQHLNEGLLSVDWGSAGTYSALNTRAAAFETANGESILLFYNPGCVANMGETGQYFSQPKMCVNMVFDLNGTKGPNTFGKDKGFLTVFYPSDSAVVAPEPFSTVFDGVNKDNASKFCTEKTSGDYRLPTKEEVASVFINRQFINLEGLAAADANLFTSTKLYRNGSTYTWVLGGISGLYKLSNSENWRAVCIKR